jgi:hypothetical protein
MNMNMKMVVALAALMACAPVTVEPVEPSAKQDVWTVLERIWQERKDLGIVGRTRAEIDAEIRTMRDEWDDSSPRRERQGSHD